MTEYDTCCFRMIELPEIGYSFMRKGLWDRQWGEHCKSLAGNVRCEGSVKLFFHQKLGFWEENNAFFAVILSEMELSKVDT